MRNSNNGINGNVTMCDFILIICQKGFKTVKAKQFESAML